MWRSHGERRSWAACPPRGTFAPWGGGQLRAAWTPSGELHPTAALSGDSAKAHVSSASHTREAPPAARVGRVKAEGQAGPRGWQALVLRLAPASSLTVTPAPPSPPSAGLCPAVGC